MGTIIVPIWLMKNWGREVKASNLANNSSQTLCNSIWQNPFGSFQCARHCVGCTTAGRDLVLKKPTIRKSGEPRMSLHSPSGGHARCEEGVCSGISWHMKLVWAASVLQRNVAFLNWANTKGLPLLSAFSRSTPRSRPLAIALFLFLLFLSSTNFSFFTVFSQFLPCINYRRKVRLDTRSCACRGAFVLLGPICQEVAGVSLNWELGPLGSQLRLCYFLLGDPELITYPRGTWMFSLDDAALRVLGVTSSIRHSPAVWPSANHLASGFVYVKWGCPWGLSGRLSYIIPVRCLAQCLVYSMLYINISY